MEREIACAIVGATGRMGQRICRLIAETDGFTLAGATEGPGHQHVGRNVQELMGLPFENVDVVAGLDAVRHEYDVIIDFTFPAVSMETIRYAARTKKCAVVGTTGFSKEQQAEIEQLSRTFACVCAPNMSLGVNTLFKLVADVAAILQEGFDVEVLEMHHRHKKDAPSGTALKVAEILAAAYGRDLNAVGVYERKGFTGQRTPEEIGMQTLRGGDVVGEHTVYFAGVGERLELTHRAQSRDCFAQGALHAARWLVDKPGGLYDMQDVLGLR
ncbi:MAG: 4-hydroxy-tetrahydrodipicolinate reductase [Deltaproteobacteria bacterium]|nr:4-hydroxy-tetrahydrodipicolinate reductase [Deltaproteobacteria bacterium]